MTEMLDKKEVLKNMIKRLHAGEDPVKIKEEFKDFIKDTDSTSIAKIEEELIKEGMPREEIHKLCDVHIALFKESIEKEKVHTPSGHPIHILIEEHRILLRFADNFKNVVQKLPEKKFSLTRQELDDIKQAAEHFQNSSSHYLREENVLFPYLEKHGITQPPAMMWMEHDKIRGIEKNIFQWIESHQKKDSKLGIGELKELVILLAETLSNHFYKETNILFPAGLKVINDNEWIDIRREFDELGYCPFTPETVMRTREEPQKSTVKPEKGSMFSFETGNLSFKEIESILNTLPVDLTFVDKEDTVRYFSQTKERIFPRTKAVIGRKVQQCHPQKSIHVVDQILDDFKKGRRDVAEFWIKLNERVIYIRYFPVRDSNDNYLGCLEVTQDITDIKSIEGEKRLL